MAVLNVQEIPRAGIDPGSALGAADAGGDECEVGDGHFVVIDNGSGAAVTVTFEVPVAVGGVVQFAPSIPAGARHYQPVPVRSGGVDGTPIERAASDRATWSYSDATSVTVAAFRAP